MASRDPEVPEADALEQAQPAIPDPSDARPAPKRKVSFEVPEADALDQEREVPAGEDDWR
jgi:hypothetical protein